MLINYSNNIFQTINEAPLKQEENSSYTFINSIKMIKELAGVSYLEKRVPQSHLYSLVPQVLE